MKNKKAEQGKQLWVAVVLDESGSMGGVTSSTISAFNEYMQDRKREAEETPTKVWLTKFSYESKVLFSGVPADKVPELNRKNYFPNGSTALNDAIGETILAVNAAAVGEEITPKIVVLILSDGQENNSVMFSQKTVKALIKKREDEGNWTFLYMGADQDARKVATTLGMQSNNAINYSNATIGKAARGASVVTNSIRARSEMQAKAAFSIGARVFNDAEDLADAEVDAEGNITLRDRK